MRGVAAIARRWSEQGVRVRIVDVGDDEAANVSLQALVARRSHDPGRCARAAGRR